MIAVLRREFVYSEKRARDALFDEVEMLLTRIEEPWMLSRLTREAGLRAAQRLPQAGFESFNWSTAARATLNAMLGAGALIASDGQPIQRTVAAQAAVVAALSSEHRDMTEAYLLETLIRRLGDVTARDHTAMAHALFRQFDPSVPRDEMEDRVALLLARLSDRVVVSETGLYTIKD